MFQISINFFILHKWREKSHKYIEHKYYVDNQLNDSCYFDRNVDLETDCEWKQQELHLKSE